MSIVIPCYNEEKNLPLLLTRLDEVIKRQDIEIILVNNGSIDNSATVFSQLIPNYFFAKLVNVPKNQGYGYGILQGLEHASGDFLGWTHADLQTDPNDIIKALELIEKNNFSSLLFIKGIRKGRKFFDNFFTIGMSVFEMIYLKRWFWEINAQPTLFHKNFFCSCKNPPFDFSLDLYIYYQAKIKKLNIQRFYVKFPKRQFGVSSWNTSFNQKLKFIYRTLDFSSRLKKTLRN